MMTESAIRLGFTPAIEWAVIAGFAATRIDQIPFNIRPSTEPIVLINVGTRGIEHQVAADVRLHRLGHEDTRALFLVVPILMAEVPHHLRPAWLIAVRAVHSRPRWHERVCKNS
jgi:hypothetical protein